jgi:hypothetical protein
MLKAKRTRFVGTSGDFASVRMVCIAAGCAIKETEKKGVQRSAH